MRNRCRRTPDISLPRSRRQSLIAFASNSSLTKFDSAPDRRFQESNSSVTKLHLTIASRMFWQLAVFNHDAGKSNNSAGACSASVLSVTGQHLASSAATNSEGIFLSKRLCQSAPRSVQSSLLAPANHEIAQRL